MNPMKRGEVDDHAVVEVRVPERGEVDNFSAEFAELFNEFFLCCDFFGLPGARVRAGLLSQGKELALFMAELFVSDLANTVERVFGEPVVVEPDRVRTGGNRERPVDRGLPAAFGIPLEVIREELFPKVVAQTPRAEALQAPISTASALSPNITRKHSRARDSISSSLPGRPEYRTK